MARPSSITRLRPELRAMIGEMRAGGSTLDEILAALEGAGGKVSRSALGRYTQRAEEPCPIGVAEELAALRGALDRLRGGVGELRQEINDLCTVHLSLMHAAITRLGEDLQRSVEVHRALAAHGMAP